MNNGEISNRITADLAFNLLTTDLTTITSLQLYVSVSETASNSMSMVTNLNTGYKIKL